MSDKNLEKKADLCAVELSMEDLEAVTGGLNASSEEALRNSIINAKNYGYSKTEFLNEILGIDELTENDFKEMDTTKRELKRFIDKIWYMQ